MRFKNGEIRKIQGYDQRDKSWGYRDWHQFDHWHHANFQFQTWSCAFRKDYQKDKVDLSGRMVTKKGCILLSELDVEVIVDKDKFNSPLLTKYKITNTEGNSFNIEARPIDNNTSFRFAREFPDGYTEMFDQMVVMKDLDTEEIGTGIANF